MPKRIRESKEERWRRKLKRYEEKLNGQNDFAPEMTLASDGDSDGGVNDVVRNPTPDVSLLPAVNHADDEVIDSMTVPAQGQTSTSAESGQNVPQNGPLDGFEADPELLQALGAFESEANKWGPDIFEDLSSRWEPLLKDGLKKEIKENILKKYLPPKNCSLIRSATLNPEISAMLNDSAKNRDLRIAKKQDQLGCILTVLGNTITEILKKTITTPDVLSNLSDAAKLLADSHYLETETRRSLLTPMIDKTFIEPFKDRKRDSHLFGEKLGDFIKTSRGIQKTGRLIQSEVPSTLNLRVPPVRQNQIRGPRSYVNRAPGGGKMNTQSGYRRRGLPYQQAATRGPPLPPPPPPAPRQRQAVATAGRRKQ